jgi:DICT domain-containing protein
MLEGSILQNLETAHRHSKTPIKFGVYYKNTLISLCHALEDQILSNDSKPLVIAAFQRGKWYLQEAERYADIAQKSCQVVIIAAPETGFTEHSTTQLSNVELVALTPTDPVAQEWHLIILSPTYTAMVICQELSEADYGATGFPTSDIERKFYGLWTFEPKLVEETAKLAIAHIARYNQELGQKLSAQQQAIQPGIATPENLAATVSRVVDYLQIGERNISVPSGIRHKALDRNLASNEIQAFLRMAQMMDVADVNNPMAAAEVVALSEIMGQILELPVWQIKRLRLAGWLHRIDTLQRTETVITPSSSLHYYKDAPSCPLTCPLVPGAQVLRTLPRLRAVAQIITHQTEWWDGTGEPAGLAGDEIPLESRILALIAEFQWLVYQKKSSELSRSEVLAQAFEECRVLTERRFDPKLVDTLALLVMGLQQGLELSLVVPKVSNGIWLVDTSMEVGS